MLTVRTLRSLNPGADKWISDGAVRGGGALWARIGPRAVSFYFRYSHNGRKRAIALGGYDETGARGLTLALAREGAARLSKLYRSGVTDLHEHLQRERNAADAARQAAEDTAKRELSTVTQFSPAVVIEKSPPLGLADR